MPQPNCSAPHEHLRSIFFSEIRRSPTRRIFNNDPREVVSSYFNVSWSPIATSRRHHSERGTGASRFLPARGQGCSTAISSFIAFGLRFTHSLERGSLIRAGLDSTRANSLGLGAITLFLTKRTSALLSSPIGAVMTLFLLWQIGCAAPFVDTYGIDTFRDSVLWAYAAFAWITAALILGLPKAIPSWSSATGGSLACT